MQNYSSQSIVGGKRKEKRKEEGLEEKQKKLKYPKR
jgi:hypothetical protein